MPYRTIRVFISSTFRDFGRERDLLNREVFPELRRRARTRGLEVAGIDLRWGITEEDAAQGATLPICLAEIDRSRPYFVGLLGDRYGWIPKVSDYPQELLANQPWVSGHAGGASVTELEILHGVLNNPAMAGRALFYLRECAWSRGRGPEFTSSDPGEIERLDNLKDRVRRSGFTVRDGYPDPETGASLVLEDLWRLIDRDFPESEIPLPRERQAMEHASYRGAGSLKLAGREEEIAFIEAWIANAKESPDQEGSSGRGLVIHARAGAGASSLLATLGSRRDDSMGGFHCFRHHCGSSGAATGLPNLLGRWLAWIDSGLGSSPGQEDASAEDAATLLPEALARLSARRHSDSPATSKAPWLVLLDDLERLVSPDHLPWLPDYIPPGVRLVICTRSESQLAACEARGWKSFEVGPLPSPACRELVLARLDHHRKRLPDPAIGRIIAHPMAVNPLFLTHLVDELALAATHETLGQQLDEYLGAVTLDDLLERILERVDGDLPPGSVGAILASLHASRDGLAEPELLGMTGLAPVVWARARLALESFLAEAEGMVRLSHPAARKAVEDRYLPDRQAIGKAHARLAAWWQEQSLDGRKACEYPWQLARSGEWAALEALLLDPVTLDSLLEHRSEAEVLEYWRDVLASSPESAGADIGESILGRYDGLWPQWEASQKGPDTGRLALRLGGFLEYAGCSSALTLHLMKLSVELASEEDPVSLALRLNNLGNEQLTLGDFNAALESFESCLEIRRKHLPPGHPHILATLDNAGQARMEAGCVEEAIGTFRRALEERTRYLGENHPDTATSQNNLAMALLRTGESDAEAGLLLEAAHRASVFSLGPAHPDTGISAGNLGLWVAKQGDFVRARVLLGEAVRIHAASLGANHPLVRVGTARMNDLPIQEGIWLRENERLPEAAALLGREADRRRLRDPGGTPLATALSALGETLARQGNLDGARAALAEAHVIRSNLLGPEDRLTRLVRDRLEKLG